MKKVLVLHICCAPDQVSVIHQLKMTTQLHCFFYNPNIYPEQEYQKRLFEVQSIAEHFNIPLSIGKYDPETWEEATCKYDDSYEGSDRCRYCFLLRLRKTAQFCSENGFQNFTTVLTVSPHKNASVIHQEGFVAAKEFGISFEPHNFKKNNGFLLSIQLCKELNIYRQDYCGCKMSFLRRNNKYSKKEDS